MVGHFFLDIFFGCVVRQLVDEAIGFLESADQRGDVGRLLQERQDLLDHHFAFFQLDKLDFLGLDVAHALRFEPLVQILMIAELTLAFAQRIDEVGDFADLEAL